jgi:hypothetical protein
MKRDLRVLAAAGALLLDFSAADGDIRPKEGAF